MRKTSRGTFVADWTTYCFGKCAGEVSSGLRDSSEIKRYDFLLTRALKVEEHEKVSLETLCYDSFRKKLNLKNVSTVFNAQTVSALIRVN